MTLDHKFVEYIPEELEEETLYISLSFGTVAHKCCCGCGNEVVTPLSPTDWKLTYDGETITLDPSIGNWSYECRSHYWIKNSKVLWSDQWSEVQIRSARLKDKLDKKNYFKSEEHNSANDNIKSENDFSSSLWHKFKRWIFNLTDEF